MFGGRALRRSLLVAAAVVAVLVPASAALADPSPGEVQRQIDEGNRALELVVESYNKVNTDLAATQASLAALETKMRPVLSSLDEASASVAAIARTAYVTGSGMRTMSMLLSAGTPASLIDQLGTLQELSAAQQRQIDAFTEAKQQYTGEKRRLDDLLAAQKAQQADLAAKKTHIEGDIARLDALQKKVNAATGKTTTTTTAYGPAPVLPGPGGKVVAFAWAQLNEKYVFGAAGPDTWDCSGLTMMAWKAAGKTLPHNAAEQYKVVQHISRSQLIPGDLVFYNNLGHVGIYIGNNQIIHAPNSRTVVKIGPIDGDTLYGYGRP
ncbi:NlpC/P60 family protein [Dactylosporangium sp. CA-092794]|uniref:NlpC/P60 family protein n=1 Tax=Dactylosporangium sp. CA-092794 TaxID=3239929 RepID=UPI003D8BF651